MFHYFRHATGVQMLLRGFLLACLCIASTEALNLQQVRTGGHTNGQLSECLVTRLSCIHNERMNITIYPDICFSDVDNLDDSCIDKCYKDKIFYNTLHAIIFVLAAFGFYRGAYDLANYCKLEKNATDVKNNNATDVKNNNEDQKISRVDLVVVNPFTGEPFA